MESHEEQLLQFNYKRWYFDPPLAYKCRTLYMPIAHETRIEHMIDEYERTRAANH